MRKVPLFTMYKLDLSQVLRQSKLTSPCLYQGLAYSRKHQNALIRARCTRFQNGTYPYKRLELILLGYQIKLLLLSMYASRMMFLCLNYQNSSVCYGSLLDAFTTWPTVRSFFFASDANFENLVGPTHKYILQNMSCFCFMIRDILVK